MTILIIRAFILYVIVIFSVRFMGKRQIGQMQPTELVITILISNIATMTLEDPDAPLLTGTVPILFLVSVDVIISVFTMISPKFRKFISGSPQVVIHHGVLDKMKLRTLRMSQDDLQEALRGLDIFDINEVEFAVVETNGNLTVQKKAAYMPLTSLDMNLPKQEAAMPITVVIDGKPVSEYFGSTKYSQAEIEKLVKGTGVDIKDILLMTVDINSNTFYIKKENNEI